MPLFAKQTQLLKRGEVVGKLALGIRPDTNSDSIALTINHF